MKDPGPQLHSEAVSKLLTSRNCDIINIYCLKPLCFGGTRVLWQQMSLTLSASYCQLSEGYDGHLMLSQLLCSYPPIMYSLVH